MENSQEKKKVRNVKPCFACMAGGGGGEGKKGKREAVCDKRRLQTGR